MREVQCLKQYTMKNTTSSMGSRDTLTNLVIYSHTWSTKQYTIKRQIHECTL